MDVFLGYGYALNEENLRIIFPMKKYPGFDFMNHIYSHLRDNYHAKTERSEKDLIVELNINETSGTELFIGFIIGSCKLSYGKEISHRFNLNYDIKEALLNQFKIDHPEFDNDKIHVGTYLLE